MGEGFISVEKAMTARQKVAFEPAYQGVLGKHFHDATVT